MLYKSSALKAKKNTQRRPRVSKNDSKSPHSDSKAIQKTSWGAFWTNPYRSARTGPSDASGPGRSSAALERTFLALTGSLAPTLKKIAELRATFSRFAARLSRFGAPTCSPEAPQDAPGRDFEGQNGCFFEVFACGKPSTRKTFDIDKTL